MKNLLILFIIAVIITFFNVSCANADYITTNTFVVNIQNTVAVANSGNLNSGINPFTGEMSTPINIDFNITTNEDIKDINLNAYVLDSTGTKHSAFCDTSPGISSNQKMCLTFANSVHLPEASSINNCHGTSCSSIENPNAISYPGIININNNGTLEYNSGGHYVAQVNSGVTDLRISVATTPKSGTYDFNTAQDISDTYQVEIYLDNLP